MVTTVDPESPQDPELPIDDNANSQIPVDLRCAGANEVSDLLTRLTKASDSRARDFIGQSIEIDAMPRDLLIELVETSITQQPRADERDRMFRVEAEQRNTLQPFLKSWTRRRR
jgi:hypothetical protein